MKGTICIVFILLLFNTSFAQEKEEEVPHYIFSEFKTGLVLLKDGNNYSASLNYHSLSEQMIFEADEEKLAIAKTDLLLIDTIFIEDKKFVTFDGKIVELVYNSSWDLFVEHKCKIKDKGRSIGYGQKTKTGAVSSYSSYYEGDNLYNLKISEVYLFAPFKKYWLRRNSDLVEFTELYELRKALKEYKVIFKAYLKDHDVKIEDQKGLIQLIKYVEAQSLLQFSEPYRNWNYYPDLVIPPNPEIAGYEDVKMTDVPTVFQLPNDEKWYMSFIGFDGQGYQSFIAESEDLLTWSNYRLAMGYGPEGEFDHGGVVLGAYLYEDYDIKAPRVLKSQGSRLEARDVFYSLYGAYPRQGGYELRPGYEGLAVSEDGFRWKRAQDKPILSVYQDDCGEWEQSCIYQPWLIEHEGKYYNIYNAANGSIEQLGLAVSDDLMNWKRFENNPVISHGPSGSYNEKFSSDIKIFRDDDHWIGFFFGVGQEGAHIMAAYSDDLYSWAVDPEPLYKAGGNPSGIDGRYAHKISLVWNPGNKTFYMFYCAVDKDGNRGIGLITSKKIKHQTIKLNPKP